MENFIVFKHEGNGLKPVKIEGKADNRSITVKYNKDHHQFSSDSPISPFLFGDCIFAELTGDRKVSIIPRHAQWAVRNAALINEVESSKKALQEMINATSESIDIYSKQLGEGGKLDYSKILNSIHQLNRMAKNRGLDGVLDDANYINVTVSEHRKNDPILWPIKLETESGKVKLDGFLDTGAAISMIDASLPIAKELEDPAGFVNVKGITGMPTTLPQVGLNYKSHGKKDATYFAVMSGLEDKICGNKVLLGRDIYYQVKGA